jgi:hypothetical protein
MSLTKDEKKEEIKIIKFDLINFLIGTWKRNLEVRDFGGLFQHIKMSSSIVKIEEILKNDTEKGTRYLKWSIGKNLNSK